MFNFLKRIRGTNGGAEPPVLLVALRDRSVVFETDVSIQLPSVSVTLSAPIDGRSQSRRVKIALEVGRPIGEGVYEYCGELVDASLETLEFLKHVVAYHDRGRRERAARRGELRKNGKRSRHTFQVMSREFKSFRALSGDISSTGIKLHLDEALPTGKNIDLLLNFDDERLPQIQCRADVMWCRSTENGWAAGLRFCELTDDQMATIDAYLEYTTRYVARMLRCGHITLQDAD